MVEPLENPTEVAETPTETTPETKVEKLFSQAEVNAFIGKEKKQWKTSHDLAIAAKEAEITRLTEEANIYRVHVETSIASQIDSLSDPVVKELVSALPIDKQLEWLKANGAKYANKKLVAPVPSATGEPSENMDALGKRMAQVVPYMS